MGGACGPPHLCEDEIFVTGNFEFCEAEFLKMAGLFSSKDSHM